MSTLALWNSSSVATSITKNDAATPNTRRRLERAMAPVGASSGCAHAKSQMALTMLTSTWPPEKPSTSAGSPPPARIAATRPVSVPAELTTVQKFAASGRCEATSMRPTILNGRLTKKSAAASAMAVPNSRATAGESMCISRDQLISG